MTNRYQPFVTVATVVNYQDTYLLVEERAVGNEPVITFNQPAGHLEANETITEAAQRELREETGISAELTELIAIYQYFVGDKQYVRFTFALPLTAAPQLRPHDPNIIAAHWLTLDQIKQKTASLRSPLVIQSITDYLNHGTVQAAALLSSYYVTQ
ncbi:NUDIX domain-containing protein [Psychrobium sp. 1_MG-2023]|uniref:NUDIX domain-containing protein n=1 Tax=Psychrobium sp. 1_MG-2023 TaxID=3062624 RepID=UPI000C32E9C4|nr:NUDIX hydrolase [Psychrobium sp. 1_MG-2023]MDP2561879.1 NUDIX hydrolase [Psychrobium sp. 1_MG-2023]PKF59706.1 NUDIX hydrolase [Alteromonadales bacterium alter-6D02]